MLRCDLFGHLSAPSLYVRLGSFHVIDGIDREHRSLVTECVRCGETFQLGIMHLPERHTEKALREENQRLRDLCRCGEGI